MSEENLVCTPPEIREIAEATTQNLLPDKSEAAYKKQFTKFEDWRKENNIKTVSENVLLAYFQSQREKYKPSTLWTIYSMLRSCFLINMNIDISKYAKLQALLKRTSQNYTPKKSKILEEDEINKFICEAENDKYLAMKVILIIGYNGACRREELANMTVDDIQFKSDSLTVSVPKTKNCMPRLFVIMDEKWVALIKTYFKLRPQKVTHRRFFLTFRNGKCINSPIGINRMGNICKEIASFLRLPNPELYTGHCFRRSSATHLANRGGDLLTIKRHGGWKSSAVAESYIDASLKNKIDVSQMLRPHTDVNLPGSSRDPDPPLDFNYRSNETITVHNSNVPSINIQAQDTANVTVNIYNCSCRKNN